MELSHSWHALPPKEVLQALESHEEGLRSADAEARLREQGPNELPREDRPGLLRVFLRQFTDPLIYILLIAAVVSLATGSTNNAIFIGAVLLLNAGLGTFQEHRAESSARALQEVVSVKARVLRDGERRRIDAVDLVPGDVIALESGDAVPADARLLSGRGLRADESLLTGESDPARKRADAELGEDAPLGDRETLVHAGSSILSGRATAVVCRTGASTEVGRIAKDLASGTGQVPPLVVRLRRLTRIIAAFVLGAIVVLAALQIARGDQPMDVFFLAVALAVSAIPAGLPVAITVALSIASRRLAEEHVIVRQLPAVEGLGACTLIASDKTGTLTQNVLTARRLVLADGTAASVEGDGYEAEGAVRPEDGDGEGEEHGEEQGADDGDGDEAVRDRIERLAASGVFCNEASLGGEDEDPEGDGVDLALLVLGRKLGLDREALVAEHEEVTTIPFESERKFAASVNRHDDELVAHVKGAVDVLVELCAEVDADHVREVEDALARSGHRVIAVARGIVSEDDLDGEERELHDRELVGLVGLVDPVREEVPAAVERCREAGVEVRMVTGDHPETGLSVARELGMASSDATAIRGSDLDEASRDDVVRAAVFARVEPSQKTRIVDALQDAGHFVAVTGDGVNDAAALRRAHIGVAMGRSGTDVARRAADLILTDDDFASIVAGIEQGRIAYGNVRKVTWLLLATGAGEVLLFFLALGFGLPLPLLPVQLLWLNLVTNGIQDVALAFEKGEPELLERGPRDPDEPIFDRSMVEQVLLSGGYIGTVAFGVYWYLVGTQGVPVEEARNLVLLLVVLFENVHIFSCRSERRSAFSVPLRTNPLLIVAVVAAQGVHIGAMYVPGLSDVLGLTPVSLGTWLTLLPVAMTLLVFDEVVKWVRRRTEAGGGASRAGSGEVTAAAH